MAEEIKPCPVCGAEPIETISPNNSHGHFFICSNLKCGFAEHCIPNPDRDVAIKEWNEMISACEHLYSPNRASIPVVHEEFVSFLGGK